MLSSAPGTRGLLRFRNWSISPQERMVWVQGEPAALGSRAFDVLLALVNRQGQVVSRAELLDIVWPGLVVEENNLSVQIAALRKVLGPQAITTIPGLGYRFSAMPAEAETGTAPSHAAAPVAAQPPVDRAAGNLPAALPQLFGREHDIEELARTVQAHRLVCVSGPGGIGKTRLAQAAAQRLLPQFEGGAWFVEFAPLASAVLVPSAVAQALGLALTGNDVAVEQILQGVGGRAMLLVLDNCEHVVEAVARLAQELVAKAPRLHLLLTSQAALNVREERLFPAQPLGLPASERFEDVLQSGAARLLMHRIAAKRPELRLTAANAPEVFEICRRLDGVPLALELAAGRVPLLGLAGVRQLLDEPFKVLSGGARGGPARHHSLLDTLKWSHSLLTPNEAAVFRRAGIFAGGFGLRQAQLVLGDDSLDEWAVLDLLGGLVDKSLVVVDAADPPRYRLLESTRAYALRELQTALEVEHTRQQHARWVLGQFEGALARRWQVPSQKLAQEFLPDLDNCRAAMDWAAQGDSHLHVALAGACAWLFGSTGKVLEGMERCRRALAQVDADTPPRLEARLSLAWCELAHYAAGPEKRQAAERAVALLRELGDREALYSALGRLAVTAALSGQGAEAAQVVEEMAGLYDPAWPRLARWELLYARDYVANMLGDYAAGEALALQELDLARQVGDTPKLMFSLLALEQCAATRGDFAQAVVRGRELVAMTRREPFVDRAQIYFGNLATALTMADQLDEALAVAREAVEMDRRAGTLWQSLDYLGMLACKLGRPQDAALLMGRSDASNVWRRAFREPVEQRVRDSLGAAVAAALPEPTLRALRERGAQLSDDLAARLALGEAAIDELT